MSMQQQPDMPPFSPAGWRGPAGAPSPISSRPPAPGPGQQQQLDELVAAASGSGSGSLNGQEGLAGEEGERGGSSSAGNRWPRQETLALLKIRSEMDAAFREAALKGPLWEDVSRRLAEMGYRRSAKKCREKFENVDKYYRRTKDGRAGRGDGKTYRFFSELEALHGAAHHPTPVTVAPPAAAKVTPTTISVASGPSPAPLPPPVVPQPAPSRATDAAALVVTVGDASFSGSEGSDGEDTDETAEGGKRKRRSWSGCGGGGGGGKAMRFFEGLVRQVMERQEAMQQRLLEAIERRDQERMIREEAWRRQEVARLAREQDQLAHERAVAASRDAAVVSFIQRVTGQIVPVPTSIPAPATITSLKSPPLQPAPVVSAAPAPPPSQHHQAPPVQAPQHTMAMPTQPRTPMPHVMPMPARPQTPQPPSKEIVRVAPEPQETTAGAGGCGGGASPSRWPKAEVHALIQLRTEMETRYQDAAPKGPLWEDISAGMRRLGYSRSAKRCKEKWENINKYFKKVKESSRKRPEDSKTCPYFHQLDALYRTKALATSGVNAASPRPDQAAVTVLAAVPLSQTAPAHVEHGGKNCSNGNGNGNGNGCASNGGSSGGTQMKVSNGGAVASFSSVEGAGNGVATNMLGSKQEGAVKEMTTEQPATMNTSYGNHRSVDNDMDSDSMDEEDEDDFDDDEDDAGGGRNMQVQYDIHFQRQQHHQQNLPNVNGGGAGGSNAPAGPAAPAAAATSGTPFLAMVQ